MSMKEYARKWKPPEERAERKREAAHKGAHKDTPDSKGPGPNDWKKGATSKPKGC